MVPKSVADCNCFYLFESEIAQPVKAYSTSNFPLRKANSFYSMRLRSKKLQMLNLLNQHRLQLSSMYRHHHSVVIAILLDISDHNVLIAIETSFYKYMCFWEDTVPCPFGPWSKVAHSVVDYVML
ncbi:hypothetical protein MAP00_006429 [Monascus purpureus]|nr:hypothetical protein MAP00_006429 [Monascus purpureus]